MMRCVAGPRICFRKSILNAVVHIAVWVLALFFSASVRADTPNVSVESVDQIPGTKSVEIRYDATGIGEDTGLSLIVSDGDAVIDTVTGLTAGTGQTVIWDAVAKWDGQHGELMFTVTTSSPVPEGMIFVQGGTLPDIGNGVITVGSFLIGKYEVTWGEWKAVRAEAAARGYDIGSRGGGCADDHPVHTVNWYDVVKWCNLRSEIEGLTPVYTVGGNIYRTGQHNNVDVNASATGYRLPTDAEWEFAARGGIHSQGYEYSGSDNVNAVAWYLDNSGGAACDYSLGRGTWPVGQKSANELGIHDMSGNVREWCFDWHPAAVGSARVFRGGSWGDTEIHCRVAYPYGLNPVYDLTADNGFRAVLPPDSAFAP